MTTTFSNVYEHHQGPEISDFGPSKTKQEFLEESDINNILERYEATGLAPQNPNAGMYGDFSDPALQNYQEAMNMVIGAQELFERLPPKTRERFANDPANLIMFVQDPNNQAEAHQLGLLRDDYKSPSAPPAPAPVTPETKP